MFQSRGAAAEFRRDAPPPLRGFTRRVRLRTAGCRPRLNSRPRSAATHRISVSVMKNKPSLLGTTTATQTDVDVWRELILGKTAVGDARSTWHAIFALLKDLALATGDPTALHKQLVLPDGLLAESAWDLWEQFRPAAPSVVDELKQFWAAGSTAGTAVLILDGLSLRELPLILAAASERGIPLVRIEVRGAEVPTETDQFASALGIAGRSKLYNNRAPAGFIFAGSDVYTDVLDGPFADCVTSIPASTRLFIWHKWPDEPLIHLHEDKPDGPAIVTAATRKELSSDGFWSFVDRLRQGRRLAITSDHGYAVGKLFSSERTDKDIVKLLRETFGAKRSAKVRPDRPWPRCHLPPLVCQHGDWLVVMGQYKWASPGGFPNLCHRGLSLLEAAVAFIELPPK